jgi:hypothetical protein
MATESVKNFYNLAVGAHIDAKEERESLDFYASDPNNLVRFLDRIKEDHDITLSQNIWECCCGSGELSEVLTSRGYDVFNTDIENRGYKNQHLTKDFFEFTNKFNGDILTNPPFSLAEKMINHALELVDYGRYVIMFARIQLLEGTQRYESLFANQSLKFVYVFSSRARTAKNGDFDKYKAAPALCYAWFCFQKGHLGEPIIRWIK